MARIEWNPISIPDIGSSAIQAQAIAGRTIQDAIQSFSGVVGQWEGDQRDKNLAELIARQNAFAGLDPKAYEAALQSGELTAGLNYLKPEQIAAARAYAGELRQTRAQDTAYDQGQIRFGNEQTVFGQGQSDRQRVEGERVALNEATKAVLPAIQEAIRTGNTDGYMAALNTAMAANPNMSAAQVEAMIGLGTNAAQEGRTVKGWNQNYTQGETRFGWETEDRTVQADALALAQRYVNFNGTNEDLMADPAYQAAPPRVQAMALQQLGRAAPTSTSTGSFGAPDMGAAQQTVATTLAASGLPAPVVAGFMGNFHVEGGYGGALGDGGTASGIAQWRGPRRAAFVQRFGKEPHQASHEEQAQFAAWELTTPEGRAVAGISEANANRILNARTPGEAASLIDQYYERSDGRHRQDRIRAAEQFSPRQVQGQSTDLAVGASVAAASDRNGPMARNIAAALQDDTPTIQVVKSLTADETSPFFGMDEGRMGRLVRDVQDRYSARTGGGRLPAAAAAQILIGSTSPFDFGKDAIGNIFGQSSGLRRDGEWVASNTVNWRQVDSALGQLRPDENGQIPLAAGVRNQENLATVSAQAQQGRAQLANAQAQLAQAEARDIQMRQPNNPVTARLRQQVAQLEQQWGAFVQEGASIVQATGATGRPAQRQPVASSPSPVWAGPPRRGPSLVRFQ